MALTLYELEGQDGRRPSPFCWRTRYALAHKGLAADIRPVGYGDIARIGDGSFKTVPVLEHDGKFIGDSWLIAIQLDRDFPDTTLLFPNEEAFSYAQFIEKWLFAQILMLLHPAMALSMHEHARPEDQAYYRESREARFGITLEEAARRGRENLGALNVTLEPLRAKVRDTPFLCGSKPGYADYVALSPFLWARAGYPHPLITRDDPIAAWVDRCLDLYGGLGRSTPGYEIAG